MFISLKFVHKVVGDVVLRAPKTPEKKEELPEEVDDDDDCSDCAAADVVGVPEIDQSLLRGHT